jgi:alcohol dehydrogenase class IV
MSENAFRASGYSWRLHCGRQVIEQGLPQAVDRADAERAFVVCSRSVNRRTDIVRRIAEALGDRYAGVFDGIEKDSTYVSVRAATTAAREAGADLLIAVGGGSVIVATRAVAIFMAEPGDPFRIMTQYPEGKPAYSPRLLAPKPPIINVPTTPTSAMNRAGTGLKNPDLDHRMEYFDPKTRPQAIFLDEDALFGAPPDLIRSTATTVFAGLVGAMAQTDINPLAQGDRNHAFRLAHGAYPRLVDELDNPSLRTDLCIAAFLMNRAEDDGARRIRDGAFSGNYAVSDRGRNAAARGRILKRRRIPCFNAERPA